MRWWLEKAACAGSPPQWFDLGDDGNAEALKLCGSCPVRRECLTDALTSNVFGLIQGGVEHMELSKRKRAQLRRDFPNPLRKS